MAGIEVMSVQAEQRKVGEGHQMDSAFNPRARAEATPTRWSWPPAATIERSLFVEEFSLQAIVLAVLVGGVTLVFWQQLVGAAVFIGESDRLNSYLNIRLAEYDGLRTYGRVATWNPTMFTGFSMSALHWMNPGMDPIPYVLQLFARDRVYQVMGYVSIALVLAACTTAYFYIRELTGARLSAAIGALCYGLSVFGVHRIAQVDNAYLTLILLPAAMLAIRRVQWGHLIWPFIGLTLSMSALVFWGFLQEVAYAFCFLAAYALYRAIASWKCGATTTLVVLVVFGTSSVVALLFGAPRLITIGSEFLQLARTSEYHHPAYHEFLRFFHEGIYGRSFSESRLVSNTLNLSEGLQLVSSTTVALFVCFGVLRPTRRLELIAGLLLFGMIFAIRPVFHLPASPSWPSQELLNIGLFVLILSLIVLLLRKGDRYLRFGRCFARWFPTSPRPPETVFHLLALVITLFLILVPEAHYTIYLMFDRIDFTHTRLSILALLPVCSLFAIYLAELKVLSFSSVIARLRTTRAVVIAIGIVCVAALLSWLIHGPILDQLVFRTDRPVALLLPQPPHAILFLIAVKVILTTAIFAAVLAVLFWMPSHIFDGRIVATIAVATFAFIETVTYAHFKVNGLHTWSYPVPFGGSFNYMNVPPSVMRPPGEEKLKAFAEKLQVEEFRSVTLGLPSFQAGAITPHFSQFWHSRMVGGYGTGVPQRLAELPWPNIGYSLRQIELKTMSDVNPALLSLLNVRYLVIPTANLYFDTTSESPDASILTLGGTSYPGEIVNIHGILFGLIRNSVAPLPRHFLVERVTGVQETPRMRGAALEARAYPASESQDGADPSALVRESIDQLTSHSLAERFQGTQTFDPSGPLAVAYNADVIDVHVTPSNRDRFLVLNERYHLNWNARAQTEKIPVFPTNAIMMGIRIPANLDRIQLRFEPFSSTWTAHMLISLAFSIFLAAIAAFWLWSRRMPRQRP